MILQTLKRNSRTIIIHICSWCILFSFPFWFEGKGPRHFHFLEYIENNIFLVALFYINYILIIPYYFSKRKFLTYFFCVAGTLIALIIFMFAFEKVINSHHADFDRIFFRTFWWGILITGVSTSVRVTQKWLISENQKNEIENEKLTSELAFLKSQISPHFLFNTLNNIYSLAYKKSDDAPTAIVKLSSLMRYMLYDSKENKVFLNNELEYLHNYIDLQRLRLSDSVEIKFEIHGEVDGILIEPLLLIPFVENAFKHGISYVEKTIISIYLKVKKTELFFSVENPLPLQKTETGQNSGIGLNNIKRRLELLYPNQHTINISEKNRIFKTELHIQFS